MTNKAIHIYYINRIKSLLLDIFEEEDNDKVDYRVIRAKERAIDNVFKKANITDEKLQHEFLTNVSWSCDDCVEKLERLGWTILRGKIL